jgi:GDP-D-mannose 3', 5'-epimerase
MNHLAPDRTGTTLELPESRLRRRAEFWPSTKAHTQARKATGSGHISTLCCMKKALVLGAGGFIGSHMVKRLKVEGYWVRGVDLKESEFSPTQADDFVIADLRNSNSVIKVLTLESPDITFDEIYQFAADMGGAGFVFTGENDADIMHNSATINLNVLDSQRLLNEKNHVNKTKIFYSGSACMYPEHNQLDPDNPNCEESSAYPANPDSEYGWEKLFSERLFLAYHRNHNIPVAIARYHNIYGPEGTWDGGREKAPAAICRKIAKLPAEGGEIEVWGDGLQTRSFLYIDECIEATRRLMQSNFAEPINIGSEEMVTINQLIEIVSEVSGKKVSKKHKLDAPTGVRGRNSSNDLIRRVLGWDYQMSLKEGLTKTYSWINDQARNPIPTH